MGTCNHGVIEDFSRLTFTTGKPVRIWKCSACGKRDQWGNTWRHYGQLACKSCGAEPAIEFVACSPKCREERPKGKRALGGE